VLICPVRACRLPLAREERRVVCGRGHSFDIARSGYINLLQPQDRRSRQPGDTAAAVAGRRRLHDRGVTMPLLETVAQLIDASSADSVLDVGCGNGDMLGTLAATANFEACGVDISVAAVDAAARRYPNCQWIVANADSFIPYQDGCFSILLSITARMNPAEFRRVLREDGRLLVAIPAPADLVELRGAGRDRVERTVQTFAPGFQLLEHRREKTEADLDRAALEDVLHSIYRPAQPRSEVLRVTFSLDFLLFRPA
jgi:23S rRNA (guanine745-N1)-methyltransferase